MAFRTIVVKNRCKLSYSLNYLIIRGEEELKIHLSEIETLLIESTAVAITTSLISELSSRNINTVFCNNKHNPEAQIIPYNGCHNSALKIREQTNWDKSFFDILWKKIVQFKILAQERVLKKYGCKENNILKKYRMEVQNNDSSNREGHAAKVYFNALFGKDYSRAKNLFVNMVLNYGYTILLSLFNREIVSCGYLTQIGIHHRSEYNTFNLSCDLMEPFRPIIDDFSLSGKLNKKNFKKELNKLGDLKMRINNKNMNLYNTIRLYLRHIFRSLNNCNLDEVINYDSYEF